jgi:hypothetical protein
MAIPVVTSISRSIDFDHCGCWDRMATHLPREFRSSINRHLPVHFDVVVTHLANNETV